jgi:hypothetical protein
MFRNIGLAAVGVVILAGLACAQAKSEPQIIAEALSALPEPLRDGATVLAFRNGELVTLRKGGGQMICLGDDPAREGWHVACYHSDLEPFMARGRELRAQGITDRAAIDSIRLAEIESGALPFPDGPRALYSLFADGEAVDPETGEAQGARGLYVLYVPYATEASTGMPTAPSGERPWLMDPGRPWAHLMIRR